MDMINQLEQQCQQMLRDIVELKKQIETSQIKVNNKSTYHQKQDILKFMEDHKDVPLDIYYEGGTKSGWRCECFVKYSNKTHVQISKSENIRTFLLGKIREIRVSDSGKEQALKNYEQFYKLESGKAKLKDIERSSAGISGWYKYKHPEQPTIQSNDQSSETFENFTKNFGNFHIGCHKRSKNL